MDPVLIRLWNGFVDLRSVVGTRSLPILLRQRISAGSEIGNEIRYLGQIL